MQSFEESKTVTNRFYKSNFDVTSNNNQNLYAALDLGTNNCRLLIAFPTRPHKFKVVNAFSRIVRLGEGLSQTKFLNQAAMDRAIEALKICSKKLESCNIQHKRFIATEACRSTYNGMEFIDRVREETGLQLEIVNRETEARLAVASCGSLIDKRSKAVVLFDIGGGSSEIALIDISNRHSSHLADHIIAWTSLPIGVVTLAEHFKDKALSNNNFLAMKDYVSQMLECFEGKNKLGDLVKSEHFHLIGTSGTVTTLAGLHLELEAYDRRLIDGMWMKSCEINQITKKLLSWNMQQRINNPCIGVERADLVLAGCAILEAIRSVWPSGRLRVADRGLREGILIELMTQSGVWKKRRLRNKYGLYR